MASRKKRKWEDFKGKLPKYTGGEVDYIVRVTNRKLELLEEFQKTVDFADYLKKNNLRKEELEKELSDVNLNLEATQQILAERFENEGTQSIRLSSGELFYLEEVPYTQVKDKHAVNNWFETNNMKEMFSVNWNSLNALVKERLQSGQPLPEGVDVFMKTTVKMRKG